MASPAAFNVIAEPVSVCSAADWPAPVSTDVSESTTEVLLVTEKYAAASVAVDVTGCRT